MSCFCVPAVSIPQLKDLHNLVTPDYAAYWRVIGINIGLKVGLLDIIDHDHPNRAEDCCNAVWKQWLDVDPKASWGTLIQVLGSPAVVDLTRKALATTSKNSPQDLAPVLVSDACIQLQKFYIRERYKSSEDEWPSYQPEHYTSVALIHHKEKYVTTREVISIANVMHKGEINVGFVSEESKMYPDSTMTRGSKITTNISEIFAKHNFTGKQKDIGFILIEGSPGIGKTILAKEVAFQWANNKLLADKMLLFLIFLRDPCLQNIQTLQEFVFYVTNSAQRNSQVIAVEQYLSETSGEYCTIVLDGYDEISEEMRCNSFISKIITRKILKLCSLVITSRPTASAVLHHVVDWRVEILGFTKEHRSKYIYHSLEGNMNEIKRVEEYFKANPFIDSLCYIPLNMTILICLVKESLGSSSGLPKTQTEINKQFTFITIARYLKKIHNQESRKLSIKNLPKPYKKQFKNLAKIAFVFLGKDKIVFNDDDIATDCPGCVGKWDSLGLLKIVKYNKFLSLS